jgi:hypothetical protein
MSAAQRTAVGTRMLAYWAKRRGEKASVGNGAAKRKRKGGMSAEARKRQSERIPAYWAAKRGVKADGSGQGTQSEAASQNDAGRRRRGGRTGRKQGQKK